MSAGNDREFIDYLQNKEKGGRSMKCPLMFMTWQATETKTKFEPMDCIKEECAWWRDDIQMCAVKDLSLELAHTQHRLADMVDKMPHEEQFRT